MALRILHSHARLLRSQHMNRFWLKCRWGTNQYGERHSSDDSSTQWVRNIDRRRRALEIKLEPGETARVFFRCDHRPLFAGASFLLTAQVGAWAWMTYSMSISEVERSLVQKAVSFSALGFASATLFMVPYLAKRIVRKIALLPNAQLTITTHMPDIFGSTHLMPLDQTHLLPLNDQRVMALRHEKMTYNYILDTKGGTFVATDVEGFKSLMRPPEMAMQKTQKEMVEFVHSTASEADAARFVTSSSPASETIAWDRVCVAVTRERRIRQYRNKKGRLGRLWASRRRGERISNEANRHANDGSVVD